VPESEENDAFFGCPSNASRDTAFPRVGSAAAESGTGSLLGAAFGPYAVADQPPAVKLTYLDLKKAES
jgi:hypothetical protein